MKPNNITRYLIKPHKTNKLELSQTHKPLVSKSPEAVVRRCFFKISQILQISTCVGVSL